MLRIDFHGPFSGITVQATTSGIQQRNEKVVMVDKDRL